MEEACEKKKQISFIICIPPERFLTLCCITNKNQLNSFCWILYFLYISDRPSSYNSDR